MVGVPVPNTASRSSHPRTQERAKWLPEPQLIRRTLGTFIRGTGKNAFAKMDVQLDLFMMTTQPQRKWGKEELLKDYAAILKQRQPGQVKLIAGEQWAMMNDALYKEDRVCVPESHPEERL